MSFKHQTNKRRIEPHKNFVDISIKEIWEYRDLFYYLVWRDFVIRYRQTLIGVAWAIFQPLFSTGIFTIVFGNWAKMPSDGLPYPIFTFSAMLPWIFFSTGLYHGTTSLIGNRELIVKVYFPRIIIPGYAIVGNGCNFLISLCFLFVLMAWYGIYPDSRLIFFPFFVLMTLLSVFGVSLWLSALNVRYRDIQNTIPLLTQVCFFMTPVIYPTSIIEEPFRFWMSFNPMTGIIGGFRWSLLGVENVSTISMAISSMVAILLFLSGLVYFYRTEQFFADII
ncbi:phosphate ABC transporter permease [Candidatus Magnetomorum sp. HK-1]|nr:phosphate ABC transporter permease [Candidatus Magnetomorum sp. HK-1]